MSAPIPLGTGIYEPTDAQVTAARAWFAAHPATRDRVVVEARLRWVIRGLQRHHLPVLMEEVLEGTGATWTDPETWPARWPAEWAAEGEVIARPAPEPDPAPELPPMPRLMRQPRPKGRARTLDEVQAAAPPAPGSEVPLDVALVPAREASAAKPRAPKPPKESVRMMTFSRVQEGSLVWGTPGAEGLPVRALRVPVHLRPAAYGELTPAALRLTQVMMMARLSKQPMGLFEMLERANVTQKTVSKLFIMLRKSGLMLSGYVMPRDPRSRKRGTQPDYAHGLTPLGMRVARAVPDPLDAEAAGDLARADAQDMEVLELLRQAHLDGRTWVPAVEVAGEGYYNATLRLQVAGVVERARIDRAAPMVRLTPAVQVAWGCVCLPGGAE